MNQAHQQAQPRAQQRPFVVALTGGIACGKSAVSHYLQMQHQLPIIDTDVIARQIVQPQQPAWQAIKARYGEPIVDRQGNLLRQQLRDIIFNDEQERQWLNQLTHPLIEQIAQQQLAQLAEQQQSLAILVIPLLHQQSSYCAWVDHVLVIDCDEQQQTERLQQRDGITSELAQQIQATQISRSERLQLADSVISNHTDIDQLQHACDAWLEKIKRLLVKRASIN